MNTRSVLASALVGASLALGVSSYVQGPTPAAAPTAGLSPVNTVETPVPVAPVGPAAPRKTDTDTRTTADRVAVAGKPTTENTGKTTKTATKKAAAEKITARGTAGSTKKGNSAADCERIGNESSMPNSDLYPYLRSIGCGPWLDSAIDDAAAKNGGRGAH